MRGGDWNVFHEHILLSAQLQREVGQLEKCLRDVLIMDPWLTNKPETTKCSTSCFAVEPLARPALSLTPALV